MRSARLRWRAGLSLVVGTILLASVGAGPREAAGQTAALGAGSVRGLVVDPRRAPLPGAAVSVRNEDGGATAKTSSDGQGRYAASGLPAGRYAVEVSAAGFATAKKTDVAVAAGAATEVAVTLQMGDVAEEITVQANAAASVAAALAPMDAPLEETSPRTEISQSYIANFTAPTADYGEIVALAPGTFTTNGNGVGLGQSKTYFRGFPDGDYDIDFDGIPFYDTNTPTHHSWAFFPSEWIGGVDFDRSPGTAATIGPTPFGGSIHLLSRELSPVENVRGGVAYGSWNTQLYDGTMDTGALLPGHRLSLSTDVQHMSSDGYQTFNHQRRSAGELKAQYRLSENATLTGFSGVVRLNANTPNFNATRCQMYGAGAGYSCTGTLAPFAGSGLNFYLTNNSDPNNWLDYQYNLYQIPTDFEYVEYKATPGRHVTVDVKPYTYDYDNGELYTNATPITEATTINGSSTYLGVAIKPCDVGVTKSGVTALPCGVDKYNSYRKYGETSEVTQTSRFGVLRTGLWYEWAKTNRHQFPSDPLNHWQDQAFSKFNERFWNNSLQPFVEYQWNVTDRLKVTPGVKYAYNSISTMQFADDGGTIGCLAANCANASPNAFISNYGSYSAWLPSVDGNYRLRNNWSVYGQLATGTIVPPSNVYDYNQTVSATNPHPSIGQAPKQQRSTTYQFGTVMKLKRVTLDADYYHIRFQNSYSSYTDQATDTQYFYLQPASITKGFEAESNLYLGRGISGYLNATVGRAFYVGNVYQSCVAKATGCTSASPLLTEAAPAGLWVAQTPSDTEAEGVTYQRREWDLGMFNKRVGQMWLDNGSYHNQMAIQPFSVTNLFLNYTIRSGSRFDQTKVRVSVNNLFNQSNITSVGGLSAVAAAPALAANGTTYADAFNTNGPTPIAGSDSVSVLAGRSIMVGVTFGWSPRR